MRPDEHELRLVDKHKLRPHNDLRQCENKLGRPGVNKLTPASHKLRIDLDELRASVDKLRPYKHELLPKEHDAWDQM